MTNTHGGKRPNAGAKKTLPNNATPRSIRLTDDELIQVKELIQKLRCK